MHLQPTDTAQDCTLKNLSHHFGLTGLRERRKLATTVRPFAHVPALWVAGSRVPMLAALRGLGAPAAASPPRHTLFSRAASSASFRAGGAALFPNFLPKSDFEAVKAACRSARGKFKAEEGSLAVGRLGHVLEKCSAAHASVSKDTVTERVNRLAGLPSPPLVLSEFPVEMRLYKKSSGMDWHKDDQLFSAPQCEAVLTLSNTSDSVTEWITADGEHNSAWTPPNSLLLVRAGVSGARHRVRGITGAYVLN